MGDALADLRLPRDAWCVSSKVFFGASDSPRPTQRGLSRKHVVEACQQALKRLRVEYLDLYFCHRPDPDAPIGSDGSPFTRLGEMNRKSIEPLPASVMSACPSG